MFRTPLLLGIVFLLVVGTYPKEAVAGQRQADAPSGGVAPVVADDDADLAPPVEAQQVVAASGTPPEDAAAADPLAADVGYDDEPPLDYPQRLWRQYTRQVRPQRFTQRDLRRQYGTNPPFTGYGFGDGGPYGYRAWGPGAGYAYGVDPGAAYIQGRYDERRFREWKERHDRGKSAYLAAMTDGLRLFREADYAGAAGHFVRASRLNAGDPASRLHAAYALVAIGNYAAAAALVVRAIELQSQLPYLPLSIRGEYGLAIDFDAHWQRLREAANVAESDVDLWFLVAFYAHFTHDGSTARTAIENVRICAPDDYDDYAFEQLAEAAGILAPSGSSKVDGPPE